MTEKYYTVATKSADQFQTIHDYLVQDGSPDAGIPARCINCADEMQHSGTRGIFSLTEEEATELRARSDIEYVELATQYNKDVYKVDPDQLTCEVPSKYRYSTTTRNYMQFGGVTPITPTVTELNRSSSQLYRMSQELTPWFGASNTSVLTNRNAQRGSGKDVDVVVGDNGSWIGHVEFMMGVVNAEYPADFIAGNTLSRRDGSTSNSTCNVLDMVLDSPYYLDPTWFNADPGNRLETRWDGTVVPVESVARAWWASAAGRSVDFPDFGGVVIDTLYTRVAANGSNTSLPSDGTHGTQCASLTFGRTHGWAYNANKWVIDAYSSIGIWFEEYFDVMKIFHTYKPINSTYGTKDPTISSNSWGFRTQPRSSGYYNHRGTDISYSTDSTSPQIMRVASTSGDGRMKHFFKPQGYLTAGQELIDSGVIFVGAAGNDSQQQTKPDHPNYNNFHNSTTGATWDQTSWTELGGASAYATTNRPGFPQQIGGPTQDDLFPVIIIGALDDDFSGGAENKAYYSDCGPAVDCFAVADGTIAATPGTYGSDIPRYDNSYSGGTITSRDVYFNGTSAACPVACGMIATLLEHNRAWGWRDVKNYIKTTINPQTTTYFTGQNSDWDSATDSRWMDTTNLAGADPIILYETAYESTNDIPIPRKLIQNLTLKGNINIRFRE